MATDLDTTAQQLLACVCEALAAEDVDRPVCSCYKTIGPPVIGLCCECSSGTTGEATIHVEQVYDCDSETLEQVTRVHPCRRGTTAADMTIVVTRCYPTIDEQGQMPDTDDQDVAATSMHDDIGVVFKALTCGCADIRLTVRNIAVDAPPDAGCAVLVARVTAEVKL